MRTLSRCAGILIVIVSAAASLRAQETAEARAESLIKSGKPADALTVLDAARPPAGSLLAARLDLLRSNALRAIGRPADAAPAAERALNTGAASRDHAIVARARLQLAQLAADHGDNQKAAAHLAAALPASRAAKDTILSISVLEALGRNARARGDNQGALAHQGEAITAAEDAGSLDLIVRARGARSTTLLGLGRFDEALADAQAAYDRLPADAPARLRASAAFALAQVQAHLWNLDRAVVLWGDALDHYRKAGLQIGVAATTKQRMDTWLALGELDKAAADGTAALALFERTGSAGTTPELFARLALIEARRGNAARARELAARAEPQASVDPRRRFTENDLGLTSLYLGDYDGAVSRFTRVHEQAIALGDLEYAWRALHMRGRARLASGSQAAAERDLREAVATLERMRRTLPDAGLRASFMSDRRDVYATLAEATLRRPGAADDARALDAMSIAEQSRARSLVEQLAEADARKSDPRLERIRAEEAAWSSRLTALQQRVLALPEAERPAALADLDRADAEYDALVIRLRRDHGAYRALVNPEPTSPQRLRTVAGAGEVLVSYLFTFDGGIAWAMRDGRIVTYRIPERRRIEAQVRLMNALVLAGDVEGLRELGASMFETLLGPARAMTAAASRLTIVADGPLHRLPFGLLRPGRDGPWLAETLPSAFVPSATALARIRGRDRGRAPQALAAFAAGGEGATRTTGLTDATVRGTLEHAAREISEIARLVDHAGDVRVMPEADETAVKTAGLGNYRVLHFAAHAAIDETAPRRSAILLGRSQADDGLLQLNEIAALDLRARLVVAAACRSHLGRGIGGEGLMSLTRAFLQAGADGVVAALWDVDDGETRTFMRLFYAGLRAGRAPDDALRHAQSRMIASGGRSAHPQNWAGFVLTGSAAAPIFTEPAPPAVPGARWLWLIAAALLPAGALAWRVRRARAPRAAIAG